MQSSEAPRFEGGLTLQVEGAYYSPVGSKAIVVSPDEALYSFECYIGEHVIELERGDGAFVLGAEPTEQWVRRLRGGVPTRRVRSVEFAVVIRGYAPDDAERKLTNGMLLPYVNGCATKQLFPPDRPGDPTWQHLVIPPHSAEQAHHIHATARVVYVLAGRGRSIVGMGKTVSNELVPGMVCILDPMVPHHFETDDEPLSVLPVHVWSSTAAEWNHPMFLGTHLTNQGE